MWVYAYTLLLLTGSQYLSMLELSKFNKLSTISKNTASVKNGRAMSTCSFTY